jgi:hypothetical protein
MIISCKTKCRLRDGTTTGLVDTETNEVICSYCNEVIDNITSFAKSTMRAKGLVLQPPKKAFSFKCITCNKSVEAVLNNEKKVIGKNCINDCKFNISKFAIHSLEILNKNGTDSDE